jgi:hypothetical protein
MMIPCDEVTCLDQKRAGRWHRRGLLLNLAGHRLVLEDGPEIATEEGEEDDISERLWIQAHRINRATWQTRQNMHEKSQGDHVQFLGRNSTGHAGRVGMIDRRQRHCSIWHQNERSSLPVPMGFEGKRPGYTLTGMTTSLREVVTAGSEIASLSGYRGCSKYSGGIITRLPLLVVPRTGRSCRDAILIEGRARLSRPPSGHWHVADGTVRGLPA